MKVRAGRRVQRQATKRYNHYLLRDLVYCSRCFSHPPEGKTFRFYGKMHCQTQYGGSHLYYPCRAKHLGYECDQPSIRVENVDAQVVGILSGLKPPKDWRKGITKAMSELLGEHNLEERLNEIKSIIKRMDLRWDNGFFTNQDEFLEQRIKLQHELEQLTPVPDDDLQQAANLLENFSDHYKRLKDDPEAQRELVKLIVQRVYVDGDAVVGMTLRANYHLVANNNINGPTEFSVDPSLYTCGSDGIRASACIQLVMFLLNSIP